LAGFSGVIALRDDAMKKCNAIIIAACAIAMAGCDTMHRAGKWEYREVRRIEEANQLAAQGWKLESFTATDSSSGHYEYFILKRRKE
jgi:hypothetical protein